MSDGMKDVNMGQVTAAGHGATAQLIARRWRENALPSEEALRILGADLLDDLAASISELLSQITHAQERIKDGLQTDGGHHKQWCLEGAAKALGVDLEALDYEPGIAP